MAVIWMVEIIPESITATNSGLISGRPRIKPPPDSDIVSSSPGHNAGPTGGPCRARARCRLICAVVLYNSVRRAGVAVCGSWTACQSTAGDARTIGVARRLSLPSLGGMGLKPCCRSTLSGVRQTR